MSSAVSAPAPAEPPDTSVAAPWKPEPLADQIAALQARLPEGHRRQPGLALASRRLRSGRALAEMLGVLALCGFVVFLLAQLAGCEERDGRPVARPLQCHDVGLSPDSCL